MAGIADNNHAHAVLLSLVDSHLHRLVADNLTHAVMTVNNCGCFGFLNDFKVGYGVLNTVVDAVDVDRLKTVAAVGFDSASVRLKKNVNNDLRVLFGNAYANESVTNEIFGCFPVEYYFTHELSLL